MQLQTYTVNMYVICILAKICNKQPQKVVLILLPDEESKNIVIILDFQAYAAGCNIVILASNFERVQIIPGAIHNYVRISCVDCSTDTGKIAAAYDNQVCIFEPTPLIRNDSVHVS